MIDASAVRGALVAGDNVLSVQVFDAPGSPDLLFLAELLGGPLGSRGRVPAAQAAPTLAFGPVEAAPNPAQSYVTLENPNAFAVDLSGWRLLGPLVHTFRPGTVLPAGGSLLVVADVVAFRARTTSPRGGEGRFIQGNWSGALPSSTTALELRDTTNRLAAQR